MEALSLRRFDAEPSPALDEHDEPLRRALGQVARSARRFFGVQAAAVCLPGTAGGWHVLFDGLTPASDWAGLVLADHVAARHAPVVVEDASLDARLVEDPLVHGEAGIRFAVGTTLRDHDEAPLGVLLLLDPEPRAMDAGERELFVELGTLVAVSLRTHRTAERRAGEMQRLRNTFLSNLSHEIRTPLTSILGFAEMVAADVDAPLREFLEIILSSGEQLKETLESLLELAQLESRGRPLAMQALDLAAHVRRALRRYEGEAARRGLALEASIPEGPLWVEADPEALSRVVGNLVSNAIKFTHEGSVTLHVEALDGRAAFHVRDTGVGIGETFLPHLFEGFKQESTGLSRLFEGSGIGLTIVQRLVGLMDGTVSVETMKGEGSTFSVSLPRSVPPGGPERAEARGLARDGGSDRVHVLVVEDDEAMVVLLSHLVPPGYDVTVARSAGEARELACAIRYDVLLLDIDLGHGPSGRELLPELRAIAGYDAVPAVAVTAMALPAEREVLLSDGFDGVLPKPFVRRQLLRTLQTARHLVRRRDLRPDRPPEIAAPEPTHDAAANAAADAAVEQGTLDALLSSCLEVGLIDRYEKRQGLLTLEQQGAFFRMAYPRAVRALDALLSAG